MQADSKTFFSESQKEAITVAVKEAESRTSGEIVPVLASSSDDYDRACFLSAILFSLIFTILYSCICILFPGVFAGSIILGTIVFVIVQLSGLLIGFYASTAIDGLRRAFIPHRILTRQVSRAAHQAFLQFQITHTADATGILIYVSLFEHTVVIIADRSVNQKHKPEIWSEVRDMLIDGLKNDQGDKGFVDAIRRCGEILEADFPIQSDDKNELSNELRLV